VCVSVCVRMRVHACMHMSENIKKHYHCRHYYFPDRPA